MVNVVGGPDHGLHAGMMDLGDQGGVCGDLENVWVEHGSAHLLAQLEQAGVVAVGQDASAPVRGHLELGAHGRGAKGLQDGAALEFVRGGYVGDSADLIWGPVALELEQDLDPPFLGHLVCHELGELGEGGDAGTGEGGGEPGPGIEKLDLVRGQLGDLAIAVGGALEGLIVDDHGHAVLRQDHIHLDVVDTRRDCGGKGGQRVLRGHVPVAAVRNDEWAGSGLLGPLCVKDVLRGGGDGAGDPQPGPLEPGAGGVVRIGRV